MGDAVMSVASRSFLVESLLVNDDVIQACTTSSSSSRGVAVNHSSTKLNLTKTMQTDEPLRSAARRCSVPGSEMPLQPQYQRIARYDCHSNALLNYYTYHLRSQVGLAVVVAELQPLRSLPVSDRSVAVSASVRRDDTDNVCQPLNLAASNSHVHHQQRYHHHHRHRHSRHHQHVQHRSCVTSATSDVTRQTGH